MLNELDYRAVKRKEALQSSKAGLTSGHLHFTSHFIHLADS